MTTIKQAYTIALYMLLAASLTVNFMTHWPKEGYSQYQREQLASIMLTEGDLE